MKQDLMRNRKLFANYVGCTMMHSPNGDYKLIQLGDGR